jgi:hypothetical protein
MKKFIAPLIKKLPYLREAFLERDRLRAQISQSSLFYAPGHYYSPIPCIEDIKRREASIFDQIPSTLPGIDLNVAEQLALLHKFKEYYQEQPFGADKSPGLRYFLDNPWYAWGDGIVLYCMIRLLKPKRLIEVGSGYSSCAIMDTNELFFNNAISCLFIEPYPDRFFSLISYRDRIRIDTVRQDLQDVDLTVFDSLSADDILLIDSSHVAKTGSDVNHIFSQILPRIRSGVYVHFHDVYYPFEYPKPWVYEGRGWNEAYVLRAFLQYNNAFKIQLFNSYMGEFYKDLLDREMPLFGTYAGQSIWIKKL